MIFARPQWSGGLARLALLVPFVLPSCLAAPAMPARGSPPEIALPRGEEDRAIVLITVDGARWQEVFNGVDRAQAAQAELAQAEVVDAEELTPNLHRLARERGLMLGAPGMGSAVVASGPNYVSMPGYSEIFTGRAPTRCQDNACPQATEPTIFDEVRAVSDRPKDVAVVASWEGIGRVAVAHPNEVVVSTGRHGGSNREALGVDDASRALLADAERAAPDPGVADFRPDKYTEKLALAYLAAEKPRMLFVGLGETDEYAHRGNYQGYLGALREADAFVGEVASTLDTMGERGRRTTVIVTADHGRAKNFRDHGDWAPESARVWMVALGGHAHPPAWRALAPRGEVMRLADVAPTIRTLLRVPRLAASYGNDEGSVLPELIGL